MSLEKKVKQVEQLFESLEKENLAFAQKSQLKCLAGCGKCCSKADISASVLEFLPWAFRLFQERLAEQTLQELEDSPRSICYNYQPLSIIDQSSGGCGDYIHRGLICRLFGFAANVNREGTKQMITCKNIKGDQAEYFAAAEKAINQGLYIPIFSDYYMRLMGIDFALGNKIIPINDALKLALEEVLHYYAYRPLPKGMRKVA